jgi:YD repeat-containing protein
MKRSSSLVIVLSVLALAGCATTAALEEELATTIGFTAADIIQLWGRPTSRYVTAGSEVLTWERPSGTSATGAMTSRDCSDCCNVTLFVDPTGEVYSYRYEGAGCRESEAIVHIIGRTCAFCFDVEELYF